jgi:N-methylhydantoinase B/oxoprolinase/acetone carboxylase alpha subunit
VRQVDPATLAVLLARLGGIADEMGAALQRSALSPNITERADCSAAVFDSGGELLAQAEHIPVHLGAMPLAVRAALDVCGDRVRPGDQIIVNDPYAGGTHLNDVTLIAPAFTGAGELIGWVANRAHHADVGGTTPGSMPPNATQIDEEGIRLAPTVMTETVVNEFATASRTPSERRGDLAAQLGANVVGAERLVEMFPAPFADAIAYAERRMRVALRVLGEGDSEFSDHLDDGSLIRCRVRLRDGEIEFDFVGSDPQQRGNINAVRAVTVSAVAFALRSVVDPTIPASGGSLRPVRVVTAPGSVVDAVFPAAVAAGNVEVSQRVADVCLGALAAFAPDRVGAASQGTMNNVLLGGHRADGTPWVYYETIGGGEGARPDRVGMNGIHTAMTNTRDTPVEALERTIPVRVRRYGLRRGSGGAGRWVGGEGIDKEFEVLVPATLTLIAQRRTRRPFGTAGGDAGAIGEHWLLPEGDAARARRLDGNVTVELAAGDVVRVLTPGGGGWGPRSARS